MSPYSQDKGAREMSLSRQRLCKHATIPESSLSNVRMQEMRICRKWCFLCRLRGGYISSQFCVVTSTIEKPVCKGFEIPPQQTCHSCEATRMEPRAWGQEWCILFLGDKHVGIWPSRF